MSVGERIKNRRAEINMSAQELSDKVGVSKSTIYRYEKGDIEKMGPEALKSIAKALRTDPAFLMGWGGDNKGMAGENNGTVNITNNDIDTDQVENGQATALVTQNKLLDIQSEGGDVRAEILAMQLKILEVQEKSYKAQLEILEEIKQIRASDKSNISHISETIEDDADYTTVIVDGMVAAGNGIVQDENLNMEVRIPSNSVPSKYDTVAKVVGDSMEPLIKDGDLLFIKTKSQIEMNSIGIFKVDSKNYVKKLKRDYEGGWYLQSLNNSYEEIYLTEDDDIRTIGEVVEIYKV